MTKHNLEWKPLLLWLGKSTMPTIGLFVSTPQLFVTHFQPLVPSFTSWLIFAQKETKILWIYFHGLKRRILCKTSTSIKIHIFLVDVTDYIWDCWTLEESSTVRRSTNLFVQKRLIGRPKISLSTKYY